MIFHYLDDFDENDKRANILIYLENHGKKDKVYPEDGDVMILLMVIMIKSMCMSKTMLIKPMRIIIMTISRSLQFNYRSN